MTWLKNHSLIAGLLNLQGNPRGCVYTEVLWGIPFNFYAPYVSIYMVALGLADREIGLIVSISWVCQIFLALMSGVITDKLGRRRTTLIFDILAWSVPALISAIAQNFWYFLVAGIVNSVWQITRNSWTCLMIEDAEPEQLGDIYTWVYIANQMVGFAAPLAGILIGAYSLVPTMRGLYLFAAVMFTVKAVITYLMTHETRQGVVRLHETRHQSVFHVLGEYRGVLSALLRTPQTLYSAAIMLVLSISSVISGTFWGILVTERLHLPAQNLSLFVFTKAAIVLLFFFFVMPRLHRFRINVPITFGFLGFVASQVLLITAPDGSYVFLMLSVILEACCFAAVNPLVDQVVARTVNAQERARILSILYVTIILLTSPFGWIAGLLSEMNKALPFVLNIALFTIGAVLAYQSGRDAQKRAAQVSTA